MKNFRPIKLAIILIHFPSVRVQKLIWNNVQHKSLTIDRGSSPVTIPADSAKANNNPTDL